LIDNERVFAQLMVDLADTRFVAAIRLASDSRNEPYGTAAVGAKPPFEPEGQARRLRWVERSPSTLPVI
jgi:hypothetical protein